MKRLSLLVLVVFVAALAASCGRKAVPRLPSGDAYPRSYPQGAPPKADPILADPRPERV